MANAFSKTLRLIAELPYSATVSDRQTLVTMAGFRHIEGQVKWEGSAVNFCDNLLDVLHRRGQAETLAFLDGLMGIEEVVGPERRRQLLALRNELADVAGDMWDNVRDRLPRVFVTHNLPAGASVVEKLRETLEEEGFEVLCEPGGQGDAAHWRLRLVRRLGACDGVVVFLGSGAGLDPDALYEEALILRWRSWLEDHFKLFVACLDAPARQMVSEGRWDRLGLTDKEIVYEPTEAKTLAEVTRRLGRLKRSPRRMSHTEKMEQLLAQRFENARPDFLTDALRGISSRCAQDHQQLFPASRLAREVLSAGLRAFPTVVNSLKGAVKKSELQAAYNLLAPSWVDIRSSGLILKACRPGTGRAFCVNADLPDFTGRMYIRQAYFDLTGSEFEKRVIVVTGKDGDFTTDFVLREIRTGIVERFRALKNMPDAKVTDELINRKLVERENTEGEGPTFAVFPPHLVEDSRLLNGVWKTYPTLVLVLTTGTDAQTHPTEGVEFLEPLLSPGEEEKAQTALFDYADLLD